MNLDPAHFNWDSPRFDWLVVTASNDRQAESYRVQLRQRIPVDGSSHELPGCSRVLVVADPHGKRAGSGGSTFAVLVELARALLVERPAAQSIEELFRDLQVLILHSGGDSRRLPAYAAQGKIFVPVPAISEAGEPQCLFDLVLADFCALPRSNAGRLLIGAGDLLLNLAIDAPLLDGDGVVGVSCGATPERGTQHGVYVCDQNAQASNGSSVSSFLQKPTVEMMTSAGALVDGRVRVDTGVVSIDWATIGRWLGAFGLSIDNQALKVEGLIAEVLAATCGSIDLYGHILPLLPPKQQPGIVVHSGISSLHVAALATTPFSAAHAKHCSFLHIGTSQELVEFGTQPLWGRSLSHSNRVVTIASESHIVKASGPVFIENSVPRHRTVQAAGNNLLVGMPRGASRGSALATNECMVWLPVDKDQWTLITYPIDFDWKATDMVAAAKQLNCGRAFWAAGVAEYGHFQNLLWPESNTESSAFHARLWLSGTIEEVDSIESWFVSQDKSVVASARTAWRRSQRISLAELSARVNLSRIQAQREELTSSWLSHRAIDVLKIAPLLSCARILAMTHHRSAAQLQWVTAAKKLAKKSAGELPDRGARLYRIAAVVDSNSLNASLPTLARNAIKARALPVSHVSPAASGQKLSVNAAFPARIDLAGGWTDTPPICNDCGGLVINVGIKISGSLPVRAAVHTTTNRSLGIRSLDQNQHMSVALSQSVGLAPAGHWSALARAAIAVTIAPLNQSQSRRLFNHLDSGIEITFESSVPKGSGLGTSSILAAAMVSALRRFQGHQPSTSEVHEIAQRVSLVEQLIESGGGWQDQYGGLIPGLKSLQTKPGPDQTPLITQFAMDSEIGATLRHRSLFYYTGQQRLAANILQRFICRYLDRDPATLRVIRGIQRNAQELLRALISDNPREFTRLITEYWLLKRQIDSSASNDMIDGIVAAARPHIDGYLLPGAGGGGFLLFIAKSVESKQHLMQQLTQSPPNPQAAFYPIEFDTHGPQLAVV